MTCLSYVKRHTDHGGNWSWTNMTFSKFILRWRDGKFGRNIGRKGKISDLSRELFQRTYMTFAYDFSFYLFYKNCLFIYPKKCKIFSNMSANSISRLSFKCVCLQLSIFQTESDEYLESWVKLNITWPINQTLALHPSQELHFLYISIRKKNIIFLYY